MYCTKCGNKTGEGQNFCINCGAPIRQPTLIDKDGRKRKGVLAGDDESIEPIYITELMLGNQ